MARAGLTWQNAKLPENTAVFAIGDIHGHDVALKTILNGIEKKIAALPRNTQIYVIGIGDYINRGEDSPACIDMLLAFKERMALSRGVKTVLLPGNHDIDFKRLLDAKSISPNTRGDIDLLKDPRHCIPHADGSIAAYRFSNWILSDKGKTLAKYCDVPEGFVQRSIAGKNIDEMNAMLNKLHANVPPRHRDFFDMVCKNDHLIIGDYLFTHAGVDPDKPMRKQGIDPHPDRMSTKQWSEKFPSRDALEETKRVTIKDKFLWRNNLNNCPYIVVHGHKPSKITHTTESENRFIVADIQKPYRICLDTAGKETNKDGTKRDITLTTMMIHNGKTSFMAANTREDGLLTEYSIAPDGMELAAAQFAAKSPDKAPGGARFHGR
jgi:hypothetical protein